MIPYVELGAESLALLEVIRAHLATLDMNARQSFYCEWCGSPDPDSRCQCTNDE